MTSRTQRNLVLLGCGLAVLAVAVLFRASPPAPATAVPSASASEATRTIPATAPATLSLDRRSVRDQFVGSAECARCHASQAAAYGKSHHARALVLPTPDKLETKLPGQSFSTALGGRTRFSENNGAVEVTTPGTDGRTATFPIAYAAGVSPLQQFVVKTERGKLQSLGVVWDSRTAADGGERWFHVYGPRGIAHDDSLYFTRSAQNWNHVCADCHSTFLERRYNVEEDRFDTRWAELAVGCEACHGPGAEHVQRATAGAKGGAWNAAASLVVHLKPAAPWSPSATGSPAARTQDGVEVEVCAPCHSRRQPIAEGFLPGDPLLDAFEPELLRPGRYHADGQLEGEDYEWGSFLQSRMYAAGVRCSDCHEPHSAELYAPGNALCVRCHAPARFDTESHSHHAGTSSPRCVDCHMPPAVFMQIDERRDHSIRIPRPDHSVEFGTPNACNGCHAKQPAAWAVQWVTKWYPGVARRPHFVEALGRERKGAPDARRALDALAREGTAPAIARATALEALGRFPTRTTLETLEVALSSSEPLAVYGAVLGAAELPLAERVPLLLPLAGHRLRAVRVAVGKALAGVPLGELEPAARAALERAFVAVEESFGVSLSRPETHIERSSFELARGKNEEAEAALATALRLWPCLAAAHLNRADIARQRGDEALAKREISAALGCDPENAFAHHALGLWSVRSGDARAAVTSLRKAVELAPSETRFSFVLAVAVAEAGDPKGAVEILEAALAKRPNAPELLQALSGYLERLGYGERAAEARRKLEALQQ